MLGLTIFIQKPRAEAWQSHDSRPFPSSSSSHSQEQLAGAWSYVQEPRGQATTACLGDLFLTWGWVARRTRPWGMRDMRSGEAEGWGAAEVMVGWCPARHPGMPERRLSDHPFSRGPRRAWAKHGKGFGPLVLAL